MHTPRGLLRYWLPLALSMAFGGCTLISGVNDFKAIDDGGGGVGGDDFQFTMVGMIPHATQNVDLALVDGEDRLLSRAVVRMPPLPDNPSDFPDISFDMPGVLRNVESASARFFADVNRNDVADAPGIDHSWVEPVESDGTLFFEHNTMFDALMGLPLQVVGADFVLAFDQSGAVDPRTLINRQNRVFEARLSLVEDGRVMALVQLHPDPDTELPLEFRLEGIIDSGNTYVARFFADSEPLGDGMTLSAPTEGDLVLTVSTPLLNLDR